MRYNCVREGGAAVYESLVCVRGRATVRCGATVCESLCARGPTESPCGQGPGAEGVCGMIPAHLTQWASAMSVQRCGQGADGLCEVHDAWQWVSIESVSTIFLVNVTNQTVQPDTPKDSASGRLQWHVAP